MKEKTVTSVQDSMRLHASSVEAVAASYDEPERPKKRVYWHEVHPGIWETALEIADGRRSRIKIVSRTEVLVDKR